MNVKEAKQAHHKTRTPDTIATINKRYTVDDITNFSRTPCYAFPKELQLAKACASSIAWLIMRALNCP